MKVKIVKLVNSINSVKFLTEQVLPAKASLKMAKMFNFISAELDVLEQTRKKLIKQYDLEVAEQATKENIQAFQNEMSGLLEEEIDLPFEQLCISELGPINLSVAHMMNLEFMFKDI